MFKVLFLVALVEFCSLAFSWEADKVKHAKNPAVLVYLFILLGLYLSQQYFKYVKNGQNVSEK